MKREQRNALLAGALAVACASAMTASLAAVTTPPRDEASGAAASTAASADAVIDAIIARKVAAGRLGAAAALVAREQMQLQFRALSPAAQQSVLANVRLSDVESVMQMETSLHAATAADARQSMAEAVAAERGRSQQDAIDSGKPMARLGFDGDLVYAPTVGPCRIADSRFASLGQLAPLGARQLWAFDAFGGYDFSTFQGGTGVADVGNCVGTLFTAEQPVAVVATVAVVNTTTTGSMRAWNGGPNLTVGGIVGWTAGALISNTTVIPMDRTLAAYPSSGSKRDFALYNNSGGAVDYVVDVVGYFIMNRATPLACEDKSTGSFNIPANATTYAPAPTCTSGYTFVSASATLGEGRYTSTLNSAGCRVGNLTGGVLTGSCEIRCCRVPGR